MTKLPKAFRLSEQATESLKWLVEHTGTNETAIVEMSLAFLKSKLQNPNPVVPMSSPANPAPIPPSNTSKKKRKRSKK